jgi:hypothetical protein
VWLQKGFLRRSEPALFGPVSFAPDHTALSGRPFVAKSSAAGQQKTGSEMADQQMTGSEILLKAMIDQSVDTIFGYPGGAVLPLYDALFAENALDHILVRQEGGAVHMAEGYARSTGKVGVVLVTSGPGATNAVTGLTDALMDSIPLVCITGQPTPRASRALAPSTITWSRTSMILHGSCMRPSMSRAADVPVRS